MQLDGAGIPARKTNEIMKVASGSGTHDARVHGTIGIDRVALENYAMPVRASEFRLEALDRRRMTGLPVHRGRFTGARVARNI